MPAATMPTTLAAEMLAAARRLCQEVDALRFGPPVTHVYNPLDYAWDAQAQYIERYASARKQVVLLGMNPGPFGMGQTGVPFGEVARVRGFLGIEATVKRPALEHPARPVQGFACTRSEVSGSRVWGLVEARWGTAQAFFADHYVANYCPLLFMEASGKNRTPDKLASAERAALTAACDRHLRRTIELLAPQWVIGIGGILGCLYLFYSLPTKTQLFFFAAQGIGLVLYAIYGSGAAARPAARAVVSGALMVR